MLTEAALQGWHVASGGRKYLFQCPTCSPLGPKETIRELTDMFKKFRCLAETNGSVLFCCYRCPWKWSIKLLRSNFACYPEARRLVIMIILSYVWTMCMVFAFEFDPACGYASTAHLIGPSGTSGGEMIKLTIPGNIYRQIYIYI